MNRAIVFGLSLVVAAVVLMSDSTASAREKGGRRARKQGGEQQTYSSYSQPTRVIYQMVPSDSTGWVPVPPSNMQYAPPGNYTTHGGNSFQTSYPTNPGYSTNVPTLAAPRETTMTITPIPEHAAELVELIQTLRAAGYVK